MGSKARAKRRTFRMFFVKSTAKKTNWWQTSNLNHSDVALHWIKTVDLEDNQRRFLFYNAIRAARRTLTKISNSIFQLEFFQDWELAQNQLDTIAFSWIQLDFFPTHFRPNWTRLDFFPTWQNWFQLDICWEIKFPIGNNFYIEMWNLQLEKTKSN